MADLNSDQLAGLAEQYFEGVDNMDWDSVRQTLTEDCSIEIRSHGVVHTGRDQGVKHMFEGLFDRYQKVWHGAFRHVCDVKRQSVASQFKVVNTLKDEVNGAKPTAIFSNFGTDYSAGLKFI